MGEEVIPSCGCVFCDLDLKPAVIDGKPAHRVDDMGTYVPCTKSDK